MFLIGLRRSGSVCLLLFTLTLLPLLRCPFVDFFGSLASRVFPSSLSLPSEGQDDFGRSRDALVCFPRFFLPFRLTRSSGRGGGASGHAFSAPELASVSSECRSCSLAANSCYFFCPGWLSLLISVRSTR